MGKKQRVNTNKFSFSWVATGYIPNFGFISYQVLYICQEFTLMALIDTTRGYLVMELSSDINSS